MESWFTQVFAISKTEYGKEEIGKIRELAFRHKFSLSFIQSFEEAFRCSIFHVTPAKLALIACQACSTLLERESYTGMETDLMKSAPNAILHAHCLKLLF